MILFKCQSCDQEMSAPDSQVGQFESCPACNAIVVVPDPLKAPPPRSESPKAAAAIPSAAGMAYAAKWLEQSGANANNSVGIARVLDIVGAIIAILSVLAIIVSVCLMLLVGPDSAAAAGGGIAAGIPGFLTGILFCGLGAVVSELRTIRRLLTEQIVIALANRPRP